jgi:hypothetical protein
MDPCCSGYWSENSDIKPVYFIQFLVSFCCKCVWISKNITFLDMLHRQNVASLQLRIIPDSLNNSNYMKNLKSNFLYCINNFPLLIVKNKIFLLCNYKGLKFIKSPQKLTVLNKQLEFSCWLVSETAVGAEVSRPPRTRPRFLNTLTPARLRARVRKTLYPISP